MGRETGRRWIGKGRRVLAFKGVLCYRGLYCIFSGSFTSFTNRSVGAFNFDPPLSRLAGLILDE
jgi:hypothetical protein